MHAFAQFIRASLKLIATKDEVRAGRSVGLRNTIISSALASLSRTVSARVWYNGYPGMHMKNALTGHCVNPEKESELEASCILDNRSTPPSFRMFHTPSEHYSSAVGGPRPMLRQDLGFRLVEHISYNGTELPVVELEGAKAEPVAVTGMSEIADIASAPTRPSLDLFDLLALSLTLMLFTIV